MAERNPVVLIHGLGDTCRLFRRMRAFLEKHAWTVHCVDLVPNNGDVGLDILAGQLAAYLDGVLGSSQVVDLVGFSMGGLVARYYLQQLDSAKRVQRLITISTPHRGSWTAFFRSNTGARQMRPGSEFLRDLNHNMRVFERVTFTSIWTPLDLMVIPASSAAIPEARSIRIMNVAHPLMAGDRRVLEAVKNSLDKP
jgi:triacylglycerol lipase